MTDLESDTYGDEPNPRAAPGGNNPPATLEEKIREEHRELFTSLEGLRAAKDKLKPVLESDEDLEEVANWVAQARALQRSVRTSHQKAKAPYKEGADACDKIFLTKGLQGQIDELSAVVQAIADDYTARKEEARRKELAEAAARLRDQEGEKAYEAEAMKEAGAHGVAEVLESQSEHTAKAAERLERKAAGEVKDVVRTRFEGVTAGGRQVWTYEIEDESKIDLNAMRQHVFDHELQQIITRYVNAGGRKLPGVRIFQKTVSTFR